MLMNHDIHVHELNYMHRQVSLDKKQNDTTLITKWKVKSIRNLQKKWFNAQNPT